MRRISAVADDTPVNTQLDAVLHIQTTLLAINGSFFIYKFMTIASRLLFCVYVMFLYSKCILEEAVLIERLHLLYFLCSNTLLHRAVCLVPRVCYGGLSDFSVRALRPAAAHSLPSLEGDQRLLYALHGQQDD